jgi:hypothetical protein
MVDRRGSAAALFGCGLQAALCYSALPDPRSRRCSGPEGTDAATWTCDPSPAMPCGGNSEQNRRALASAKNRGPTRQVRATLAPHNNGNGSASGCGFNRLPNEFLTAGRRVATSKKQAIGEVVEWASAATSAA